MIILGILLLKIFYLSLLLTFYAPYFIRQTCGFTKFRFDKFPPINRLIFNKKSMKRNQEREIGSVF